MGINLACVGGWAHYKLFLPLLFTPLPHLQILCNLQPVHNNVSIFLQYLLLRKLRLLQRDPLGRFALERPTFWHVSWTLTTRTGHPEPMVPSIFLVGGRSGGTGGMFLTENNFSLLLSLLFARIGGRRTPRNLPRHPPASPKGIKGTELPPSTLIPPGDL